MGQHGTVPLLPCDLDDTIVDRAATFRLWARRFLERRGLDPSHEDWLVDEDDDGYRPRRQLFASVQERLQLDDSVDELVDAFYRDFTPLFHCDDPTRQALVRVREAGWRLAVVTNGSPSQEDKIFVAGLDELVDAWCVSAIEGCRKPEPRLLEIAAERCGEPLSSAWVVGDNPEADIGAAHAAGLPSVWIRRGRTWGHPRFAPTAEADSFPGAVDVVLAAE